MSFCALSNKHRTKFSCFSGDQIKRIAVAYNQSYPNKVKTHQPIESLWRDLRVRLSNLCDSEYCWLDLPFVRNLHDPELEASFNPRGPGLGQTAGATGFGGRDKGIWLSTKNIDEAMYQFERIYPDFVYFGPVPIDFDQILTELSNLNLRRLYNSGIRRIGISFNFDPHDKRGSHWVSMMIDLSDPTKTNNGGKIAYFDSFGNCPPPHEIQSLTQRIVEEARNSLNMNLMVLCNKTRHQFSSTECGVYGIYFLEQSLQDRPFMETFSNIMSDDAIRQRRARYFRPE
jgi:hypothetical protein